MNYAYSNSPCHQCFFGLETATTLCQNRGSIVSEHKTAAYAYLIVNRHGEVAKKRSFVGEKAVDDIYEKLSTAWEEIMDNTLYFSLVMSPEDSSSKVQHIVSFVTHHSH